MVRGYHVCKSCVRALSTCTCMYVHTRNFPHCTGISDSLRVVAHLAHTWLLRGHISKTTCTIDFKLHMSIKQLSNTTHTKNEEERSSPAGAMNSFQIQTKKHYFSPTTKLH